MSPRSVLVVGGGISGLSAAHAVYREDPDARVTILEAGERLGGCLRSSTLDGAFPDGLDVGAEASLYRRPETRELCAELGLELEHPSREHSSRIYAHGELHPIPRRAVMGVPAEPESLRGLLSESEIERVAHETLTDPVDGDVSVGEFLAARLGDALVDRVVEPLLGGVYAGRCRELSLAATIPALVPAARRGSSVLEEVRGVLGPRAGAPATEAATPPPVFLSLRGGINTLARRLGESLESRGARILTSSPATSVHHEAHGWTVRSGAGEFRADLLVLAVPAPVAARLLRPLAGQPGSSAEAGAGPTPTVPAGAAMREALELLDAVPYSTSAVVSAIIDVSEEPLIGSGFLVPPTEGMFIKASTFSSNKWPWIDELLPEDRALIRISLGRHGDPEDGWQALDDERITALALADWRRITGRRAPVVTSEVRRWVQALPQPVPGFHEQRAVIDAAVAGVPGLALVGSAYEGVGIPACLARSRTEVERLLA